MPGYSLVPVDYQPDFSDYSLVPVDYDPFDGDDAVRQVQGQPGGPPQLPASGAGQPDAAPLANGGDTAAPGESYDPDSESANGVPASSPPTNTSVAQISPPYSPDDWAHSHGELKATTYTPTQRVGYLAADGLMGLGMQPYFANDLASRIGNLLGWTPLSVGGSALNLIDAKRHDDLPGVLEAAAGMIPGAKGVARGIGEELHHPWPKYLGGAIKQELVPLARSLHYEFHRRLDKYLPRNKSTAYYESLDPAERQQALQTLATCTRNFDAEHGTKLYDALLRNGFPTP